MLDKNDGGADVGVTAGVLVAAGSSLCCFSCCYWCFSGAAWDCWGILQADAKPGFMLAKCLLLWESIILAIVKQFSQYSMKMKQNFKHTGSCCC